MRTTASMFTGGGLFDRGAIAAGYAPLWGIEWDDKIAAVARRNGLNVITADATRIDYATLERPNHLHASPPCPNFSKAKTGAVETAFDIAMADAVCNALRALNPDTFTLENVVGYRKSKSFVRIAETLTALGYFWDAENLNAADFGVPQTRIRLVLRASKTLLRTYPAPVPWVGWYSAIEDLIDDLPDTKFAPWQVARLPDEYKTFIIGQGTYSAARDATEPVDTITSNNNQSAIKAFIFAGAGNTNISEATPGKGVRYCDEPAHTVASDGGGRIPKAFILDGQTNSNGNLVTLPQGDKPVFTQSATADKRPARAFINGRVVKMTIQVLGRFQTVPDHYVGLTTKINGNGFPCLFAQKVLETL